MSIHKRPPLTVHIVAHTHWDREWYQPMERFRQRLLALVADLLAEPPDPRRPFLLDGQTIILDDVIALRPELRSTLAAALQAGSLEAGPWYVLADELLSSGEALVRNLLAGRRTLAAFGASAPAVCYSPDAFGHPAALPTIAAGFGLNVGVVWRGYGGPGWPAGDTFRWRAPDGAELLTWHLPPDGYEYGSALPTEPDAAKQRWAQLDAVLSARSATGVVLLSNGADHHRRQRHLDEAVVALECAASASGHVVVRSSLAQWSRAFRDATRAAGDRVRPRAVGDNAAEVRRDIPTISGELRDSSGYTWSLQGTFATRAWQKRLVARTDRMLRSDVEPWIALQGLRSVGGVVHDVDAAPAAHAGSVAHAAHATPAAHVANEAHAAPAAHNQSATDPTTLLAHVWREFLACYPHDTLCGCSVDAVALALESRVASVRHEASELRSTALDILLQRRAELARGVPRSDWHPRLVIRNRTAHTRGGVAEVEFVSTLGDVGVGPGSTADDAPDTGTVWRVPGWTTQVLETNRRFERRESPHHYPDNDLVEVTHALVWVPSAEAVPGYGMRSVALTELAADLQPPTTETPSPSARGRRRSGPNEHTIVLENDALQLTVSEAGATLVDRKRNRTVNDLVRVTWQADHGDTYTAAPRGEVKYFQLVQARLLADGPLRASARLRYELHVPQRCAPDERFPVAAQPTSRRTTRLRVDVTLSLDAGASHVSLGVRAVDRASDHRLRIELSTNVAAGRVMADAAFGPVARGRVPSGADATLNTDSTSTAEQPTACAPLHRWVAVDGGTLGATVVSDGLAEYEVLPSGRVAVTLLRATGELSRAHLPERPGHAGWPAAVPRAQGPGVMRACLAFAPHGAFDAADAEQLANAVLLPIVGHTWRDAPAYHITESDAHGDQRHHANSQVMAGVELHGEHGVVCSAVKPADDGSGVILRALNLHDHERRATWFVPVPNASAQLVHLDETPVTHTAAAQRGRPVDGGTAFDITLDARAHVSLLVQRP